MPTDVFVVTCNSSIVHVVIGTDNEAHAKKDELATEYYRRNEAAYRQQAVAYNPIYAETGDPYKFYRRMTNWDVVPTSFTRGKGVLVSAPDSNG